MIKILKNIAMVAAVTLFSLQPLHAAEKLFLYSWFDYIPQETLDRFTAETGIEVVLDTYDSNEAMLAALKGGTYGSYDLAVPSDYMVEILVEEGMLGTFKPSELKNFGNIEPEWIDVPFDKGRKYSIPFQWGTTSFSVNRDVYKGNISTTDILFNPPAELSGKINMFDSQSEVMLVAALHLDIPQCTTDRAQLKQLNNLLLGAKKHWASFNNDGARGVLASGDALVSQMYDGISATVRDEDETNVEYAFPKQGYGYWMDNIVLFKNAPNRANALKFMDFLLNAKNIAEITNYTRYQASIKDVAPLLDEELRTQPESNPPAGIKAVFTEACDEKTQEAYDKIWVNLKK